MPGVRWMSGNDWLGQTIDAIKATNTPIDGIALHAYDGGGGVQQFMADITQQLEVIDAKGLSNVPVFLTEWNRFSGANPPDATAEANAANFVRGALKAIDRWNRTPGNHNIVGTTWFVYDSGDRNNAATAPWAGYSMKYWKTAGNPYGTSGDLQTAFEQAVDQRYRAGFVGGTKPIPASIQILDNFETGGGGAGDEGHFDKSLTFASAGSRFGFDTTLSDATRDAGANYSKAWGQKIQIYATGDARGWQVRHVSGDSHARDEHADPDPDWRRHRSGPRVLPPHRRPGRHRADRRRRQRQQRRRQHRRWPRRSTSSATTSGTFTSGICSTPPTGRAFRWRAAATA